MGHREVLSARQGGGDATVEVHFITKRDNLELGKLTVLLGLLCTLLFFLIPTPFLSDWSY